MSQANSEVLYFRPLYKLCNFLAILPPHNFGSAITSVSLRFKIYTILHILLNIGQYAHSSYGRERFVYPNMDMTVALTDKIANFMLTFLNVIIRLILVFSNGKTIKLFFNRAHNLASLETFHCCSKEKFTKHFIAFHLYILILIIFDAYLWINSVGFRMFQYYVGRSFTYYMCNLSIFLIFYSVLPMKNLFFSLSAHLETAMKNLICDDGDEQKEYVLAEFKVGRGQNPKDNCYDLRKVRQYYNLICEMVDDYNRIYGLTILVIILVVISYVLNLTDLFLVYGFSKKKIGGVQYGTDLIILCGLWMITLLIFTILLAHGCASSVSESEKISKICFYWLNEIPTLPTTSKEQLLKEELSLLSHLSSSRCPKFSAAGFFPVDFTLLGFIFGTVTSYIIISLQFIEH